MRHRFQSREKKLWNFRNKGFKVPGPLRSKDKPVGLDSLAGLDKIRTEAANMVYSAAAIIKFCVKNNVLWRTLKISPFWDYPEIAEMLRDHVGFSIYCDGLLEDSHMPVGWPLHIDGAVRQCCIHRSATLHMEI